MIDYVGDLSRMDARLLRSLAEKSDAILEFGCGASTQIFAAYGRGIVESVDTDPAWIEKTGRNIVDVVGLLGANKTLFHLYGNLRLFGEYDLIFVDGIDELRLPFALLTWPALAVGGLMCFHDTRRTVPHGPSPTTDVENLCAVVARHSMEVDCVILNQDESNISVIAKRAPLLYEDWNMLEGRTLQQIGLA